MWMPNYTKMIYWLRGKIRSLIFWRASPRLWSVADHHLGPATSRRMKEKEKERKRKKETDSKHSTMYISIFFMELWTWQAYVLFWSSLLSNSKFSRPKPRYSFPRWKQKGYCNGNFLASLRFTNLRKKLMPTWNYLSSEQLSQPCIEETIIKLASKIKTRTIFYQWSVCEL